MGRWFPDIGGAINKAFQNKFTCFECDRGKISLDIDEWQEAQDRRMRRKCPVCGEWNSFQFEGSKVYNIKGKDEL